VRVLKIRISDGEIISIKPVVRKRLVVRNTKSARIKRVWRAVLDPIYEDYLLGHEVALCSGSIGWASDSGGIYGVARTTIRGLCRDDIEEVVQDCRIHLLDSIKRYDFKRLLKPFIVKSVRNRCRNWFRLENKKRKNCVSVVSSIDGDVSIIDITPSKEKTAEEIAICQSVVLDFIQSLPEYQRKICCLYIMYDGDRVEIANRIRDDVHGREFDFDENPSKVSSAISRLKDEARGKGLGER